MRTDCVAVWTAFLLADGWGMHARTGYRCIAASCTDTDLEVLCKEKKMSNTNFAFIFSGFIFAKYNVDSLIRRKIHRPQLPTITHAQGYTQIENNRGDKHAHKLPQPR